MNWRSKLPAELFAISAIRSVTAITFTWSCIVALWVLCAVYRNPNVVIPAVVMIGAFQYHLNILGHDGIHYLLFSNRRINDSVCRWLLHAPQGVPLYLMRRNHFYHHRHLGDPNDSDAQYYDLSRFTTRSRFALWLIAAPMGGMTLPIAKKLIAFDMPRLNSPRSDNTEKEPDARSHRRQWLAVGSAQFAIFLATYLVSGELLGYVKLWLVPLLTVMTGLNSLRSCLEHASWKDSPPEERLFSFHSNALERFFLAPFNMNYHAEHHLVPAIPYRQLPTLRLWLTEREIAPGYEIKKSYLQQVLHVYSRWRSNQPRSIA